MIYLEDFNVSGSGTTAIACMNISRKYICIEKNKKYHKISLERVERYINEQNIILK